MSETTPSHFPVSTGLAGLVPAGAGPGLVRDVALVAAKACLSTIPLASLVFDIGEKAVTFANKQQMTTFLQNMAEEVDRLSIQMKHLREKIATDPIYSTMTHHAMTRVAEGDDEQTLAALRNAALNLSLANADILAKQELSRIIRMMSPLHLRVLWAYQGYWTEEDNSVEANLPISTEPAELKIGKFVRNLVPYQYIGKTVNELRTMEVLEPGSDAGLISGSPDDKLHLDNVRVSPLGEDVLRMLEPLP